jgi:hypothetical protein
MMLAAAIGCLLCYILNAAAAVVERPKYTDAAGIALMLCVSFGVTNTLVMAYGVPDAILFYPAFDALFAFMVWQAWLRTRETWKIAICGLLVAQLVMHVALIASWNNGELTIAGIRNYVLLINIDFALQLLIVGGVGATYWISRGFNDLFGVRRDLAGADVRWRR